MALRLRLYAVCTVVTLAFLTDCNAYVPATKTTSGSSSNTQIDSRTNSWMLTEAKGEDLLYVTNYYTVLVFSYPQGKLVGTLKGFYSSVGECVDSKGDVFVVNSKPRAVFEYAHGETKRLAKLVDEKAGTTGCAINPINGDLAVSGVTNYVDIFKGAKGKPISVLDKDMWYGQFCTYDDAGDLFFLGLRNTKGKPRLSELPVGSSRFTDINPDALMYDEGGIQWDNGYLTASLIVKGYATAIGQFDVSGTTAHEVGVTNLGTSYRIIQYFIDGSTVIVPNYEKHGPFDVLFYDYPAGGAPTSVITKADYARGVVVSHASTR